MRLSLRISKLKSGAWRWFYEDMDSPGVIEESGDYATWRAAEAAARQAHPSIDRVWVHAVRGRGVAFEDSL